MAKKVKKKNKVAPDRAQQHMRIVTSDVCARCRQCERGRRYLERMAQPGAIGYGVPCILTLGKNIAKTNK